MAVAKAEQPDAEALARNAVELWQARRRKQAAEQYYAVIAKDHRWQDDLFEVATEHQWTLPMIETAHQILQMIYAASLNSDKYSRITTNPNRMGGAPTIREMRIPVITIARMAAGGASEADILGLYPDLEPDDIRQALDYAREHPLIVNTQD